MTTNQNRGDAPLAYKRDDWNGYDCFRVYYIDEHGSKQTYALIIGTSEKREKFARRIVACVNACKDNSTETLETAAIGPNVAEWFRDWSALPAEAHELGVKEWAESVQRKNQELARHLENLVSLSECYCRSTFKQKQKDKCLVCKARAALSPSGPQEA